MPWFHPKSLLDKTYEIGIILKGINGTLELIGGCLVLFLSSDNINGLVKYLTQDSLQENPHGFIVKYIVKGGAELNHGSHIFAAAFLLTHGLTKVVLVVCLLLNKMWAYPWAIVFLSIFLIWQIYILATSPSFGMAFLTVLDAVIIYLVNREWQQQKLHKSQPSKLQEAL